MFTFAAKTREAPPVDSPAVLAKILHSQSLAAIVLLIATALALVIANLGIIYGERTIGEWYALLWHLQVGFRIADSNLVLPLHVWVNDGLMAIFFLLVGLEIKRELFVGELAGIRKAILPIAAAVGGMAFPAAIYAVVNVGQPGSRGWGIPMATDIAFAAGVMGLLGKRVPGNLAIFLIALAIVDDLGSVAVIALFYAESLRLASLQGGLVFLCLSLIIARLGIRHAVVYTILAVCTWVSFLDSGVHATIAGVLFAFTIPLDARYDTPNFIDRIRYLLTRFDKMEDHVNPRMVNARQQRIVRAIEAECVHVEAPLQRIESKLYPLVAFLIMPVFAFANAGVAIDFANLGTSLREPVALGIALGLVLGKQAGIMLFSLLAVRMRLAELPTGVRWVQVYGVSLLAGIGFTMSLFIAQLAFGGEHVGHESVLAGSDTALLSNAKVGVLFASLVASIAGSLVLFCTSGQAISIATSALGTDSGRINQGPTA